jgi:hypothetical protein
MTREHALETHLRFSRLRRARAASFLGGPRRDQHCAALARPGYGAASARTTRASLRLVHRRVRHARSEKREDAAPGNSALTFVRRTGLGHFRPRCLTGYDAPHPTGKRRSGRRPWPIALPCLRSIVRRTAFGIGPFGVCAPPNAPQRHVERIHPCPPCGGIWPRIKDFLMGNGGPPWDQQRAFLDGTQASVRPLHRGPRHA